MLIMAFMQCATVLVKNMQIWGVSSNHTILYYIAKYINQKGSRGKGKNVLRCSKFGFFYPQELT